MHCENCGAEDPMLDDGYTVCCNEGPCYGLTSDRYGTPEDHVIACCWAMADELFRAAGRPVPDGSCRLPDDLNDGVRF